jgi:hypothetical protein
MRFRHLITAALALLLCLGAVAPASAQPQAAASADKLLKGKFRVELEGVQRTTWATDFHDTNGCDLTMKGSGNETVRFRSKPAVIGVLSYGPTISLSRDREAASLDLNAKITRQGSMETSGEICSYGDGSGEDSPPLDCGTKRSQVTVGLDYVYKRRDFLAIRTDYAVPFGPFQMCPAGGISWPTLLDSHPVTGSEVGGELPVGDLFRHGKNIIVVSDRAVQNDGRGSESVTTIRWTLSFTRIGSGGAQLGHRG